MKENWRLWGILKGLESFEITHILSFLPCNHLQKYLCSFLLFCGIFFHSYIDDLSFMMFLCEDLHVLQWGTNKKPNSDSHAAWITLSLNCHDFFPDCSPWASTYLPLYLCSAPDRSHPTRLTAGQDLIHWAWIGRTGKSMRKMSEEETWGIVFILNLSTAHQTSPCPSSLPKAVESSLVQPHRLPRTGLQQQPRQAESWGSCSHPTRATWLFWYSHLSFQALSFWN